MEKSVLLDMYRMMLRTRLFEEAVTELWEQGKISGEMHLGIGEEAVIAAVVSQLQDGDAIASDHRGTPPFLMRGVDPKALILEFLGNPKGLCSGQGGHMHIFSKEHLCASSGIVGAAGPAATGFALSIQYKKQKNIAVAFFGEGAVNQGMLMESMNLAAAWKLPVLFVCKDNEWAITTPSEEVTGGDLLKRAEGFGIKSIELNGLDVEEIHEALSEIIPKMRKNGEPHFILAHCVHKTGHFLGDPLMRFHGNFMEEFKEVSGPLMKSAAKRKGASVGKRANNIGKVLGLIRRSGKQLKEKFDPIIILEKKMKDKKEELSTIKKEITLEIESVIKESLKLSNGGDSK